jgi:co-chaperonin GroES (HSP10)
LKPRPIWSDNSSMISEGDVIVYASGGFGKDSTVEQVEIGKDKYVFLKEGDVLAKVEEK